MVGCSLFSRQGAGLFKQGSLGIFSDPCIPPLCWRLDTLLATRAASTAGLHKDLRVDDDDALCMTSYNVEQSSVKCCVEAGPLLAGLLGDALVTYHSRRTSSIYCVILSRGLPG